MFGGILMQLPCTFCGTLVPRFPCQEINPKTGEVRKVVKCKNCRRADPDKLFWRLVNKENHPSGCWEWKGALNRDGYGVFHHSGLGEHRVHRISWRLANNRAPIPNKLLVLHKVKCHNRKCVNPEHLYLGNQACNACDSVSNGTHPSTTERGVSHYKAKLTDEDVSIIRAEYRRFNVKPLAERFGVSVSTIRDAAKRRTYR